MSKDFTSGVAAAIPPNLGKAGSFKARYHKPLAVKMNDMRYLVVIERAGTGYSAYLPDLPGCVATATTRSEVLDRIRDAIEFHIEGLREAGDSVPPPASDGEFVDIPAA